MLSGVLFFRFHLASQFLRLESRRYIRLSRWIPSFFLLRQDFFPVWKGEDRIQAPHLMNAANWRIPDRNLCISEKTAKKKAVEISTALGQQIDGFQLINKYDTE